MFRSPLAAALVAALATGIAQSAAAQDAAEQRLGAVHFETSCNETAQRRFDRGMRYQHSFWYRASKDIFEDALKADPDCAIAYWGIATSLLLNPFGVPPAANLAEGLAAIQKGKAIGAKTPREREFIDALGAFYTDYDKIDHRARVQAYLKAMAAVAQHYPQDDEAQIYYALALDVAASPADKTYSNQLKAAAILEDIFKRQPQHPGVAHYLIHSYDYPPIAEKGLDAATRYSKIAPTAPHAQHMPSHIFTRVGYWKESIAANAGSVRAAKADKEYGDQLHGQDYMVYAYLQLAQDKNARAVIDEMAAGTAVNPDLPGASFALAASPARYAMERGDWSGAAALEVRPSKFLHVMAITHFARAVGAAALAALAMIHVIDLPGTLGPTPLIGAGYLGIIAAAIGVGGAMIARSHWLVWAATGVLAAGAMGGYVLTRTVGGFLGDHSDVGNWRCQLGLAALSVEALLILLAAWQARNRATNPTDPPRPVVRRVREYSHSR